MSSIQDLNHKIASLQNMKKVMSAMNMIASTKFRQLLIKQLALLKFTEALEEIRSLLFLRILQSNSRIVNGSPGVSNIQIIIFTADRGLCGSHNSSIFKCLEKLINKLKINIDDFDITSVGSRGAKYSRKHEYKLYHSVDINEKTLQNGNLLRIAQTSLDRFLNGEIGKVYVIYNRFVSTLIQETTVQEILPLQIDSDNENNNFSAEITSDLSDEKLAESAAPLLMFYMLKSALANSYLSEHGARMTAMENASNNSQDLIDRYGSIKNRARQTAITNELSEIVSGKEAMK